MSKQKSTWMSHRVGREITVVRWGVVGRPVLLYPTAGGDAEEMERFHMLDVLEPLVSAQRIKVYSVDSVAAQRWLTEARTAAFAGKVHREFLDCVLHEVVPAIRQDCGGDQTREVIAAGASIGAFNALLAICQAPEVFSHAICMSGTYDLSKFFDGGLAPEYRAVSPIHFVPELPEGDKLEKLRQRHVLLVHGEGRAESPEESWKVAQCLGTRKIPNRVVSWGKDWPHDWTTWRKMLPLYLDELTKT